MIVEEKLKIKISNKVLSHYQKINDDLKSGDIIEIFPTQLPNGSNKKVKVKCDNCGTEKYVVYYDYNKSTKNNTEKYYCSKCRGISIKEGTKKIYGVDNVFQLESVKEQSKKTCKEIYGFEHHLQNKDILQKLKDTNNERYGVDFIPLLKKHTLESFIKKCIKIHGDLYDYSKCVYIDVETKVEILCKEHGSFWIRPYDHFLLIGCPKCKTSKGENIILNYLEENNIKYIHEKTFDDCVYKNKLPFDFYLPDYNVCIEYDGIQHFEVVDYFGGQDAYDLRVLKDKIKNKYCMDNNIILERIKYYDNIIERLKIIL